MEEIKIAYEVFFLNTEGQRPLGGNMRKWGNSVKIFS
jgi:hypothetical protein